MKYLIENQFIAKVTVAMSVAAENGAFESNHLRDVANKSETVTDPHKRICGGP